MKHGAIFDMDGTIFDTEKFYRRAWIETADFFGVEQKPTIGVEMSGVNFAQAMIIFAKYYPQLDGRKYFDKVVETATAWVADELEFLPGAKEILEFFASKKVSMAVASGSYHATIEKNLQRMGIREFFSAIVGGDDVVNGKPAPDIFLKAAAELNLAPNDCYVFEDSFNGIIAAHRAGCVPVMIPNQREPTDDIKKICAGVCKNFFEVMNTLDHQEISKRKKILRREFLSRRKNVSYYERDRISHALTEKFLATEIYRDAKILMAYASTPDELQLNELFAACFADEKILTIPLITGKGEMVAVEVPSFDALEVGAFGIMTVKRDLQKIIDAEKIDCVIVPGAAFDVHGNRLGLGGGYYDRFLPRAVNAKKIAFAYDFQLVETLPVESHDAKVDAILTI